MLQLAQYVFDKQPKTVNNLISLDQLIGAYTDGNPKFSSAFIDVIFEEVRKGKFPNAPSRLDSNYIFDDLDLAYRFIKVYRTNGIIHTCEIIEGTPYKFDMGLTNKGVYLNLSSRRTISTLRKRAEKYWKAKEPMEWPETLSLMTGPDHH